MSDAEIVSETAYEISTGTAGVILWVTSIAVEAIQNASAVPFRNWPAQVKIYSNGT